MGWGNEEMLLLQEVLCDSVSIIKPRSENKKECHHLCAIDARAP